MALVRMTAAANAPSPEDSVTQLGRILASRTFLKNPKLRQLLERLVLEGLKGAPVDEDTLGREIFGKPKDWIPMEEAVVREAMRNLRTSLARYYRAEGHRDAVVIDFPKRNGYRPRFLYNPAEQLSARVARATERLHHTFPRILSRHSLGVVEELERCIGSDPLYAPSYAALAEALLLYSMCDEHVDFSPRTRIPEAERFARKALELNDQLWQAHVALAAVHCCRFAWDEADGAFRAALAIAPDEAGGHFWYVAFLLAAGRVEEARQAVSLRMRTRPGDPHTRTIRALLLYVMRQYKEAYDELSLHAASWERVGDGLAYASGDEILIGDNWLVEVLMACLSLALNVRSSWRYAEAATTHSEVGAMNGLIVAAYSATGNIHPQFREKAMALLEKMEAQSEHQGPLSLALAYMGIGRTQDAIEKLRAACDEGNPFMAWLHLWPVFDPLRGDGKFRALLRRMKLPASAAVLAAPPLPFR